MSMTQYIDKSDLIAEIERRKEEEVSYDENGEFASWADQNHYSTLESIKNFIDTLEVIDPYKQCIQYASIEAGIKAHAEDYSFNIESELFNQLTKEQQTLWRKEIEQACISGGYAGYQLAKDPRYKKSFEVKEVDLEKEIKEVQRKYKTIEEYEGYPCTMYANNIELIAKYFFELGLKVAQKEKEPVNEDLEIEIKHCIYEPFFDLDGVAIKGATKYLTVEDIADIARYFANWQKKQDQETIELAEDHAMFAGMEKMKEQLMAKAIDAHCFGFQSAALFSFRLPADNYLVGSEVKVIVIKED